MRTAYPIAFALALALSLPQPLRGHAAAPGCGARVAVLGADLSSVGRFEVQRALAVGPHTVQLTETLADEIAQAHGLIPRRLLGRVAVSSALLRPLPAGSGLTVTSNPAITLDTPRTYANALLTAGVTDAEVRVAAPSSQEAWGTTALLGMLRAAQVACVPIDPARRNLAIRETVLTSDLALQIGSAAAPRLMAVVKAEAAAHHVTATPALAALVARAASVRSMVVPVFMRPGIIAFLRDLVVSGTYTGMARTGVSIAQLSPLQVVVRRVSHGPRSPGVPTVAPAPSNAGIWKGTVVASSDTGVTVRLASGRRSVRPATVLQVYRNGQKATLAVLQPGDAITVTTNAAGYATFVEATAPRAAVGQAASGGLHGALIAVLVALLLLLLLALPLLVALRRRRRPGGPAMASRRGPRSPSSVSFTARDNGDGDA